MLFDMSNDLKKEIQMLKSKIIELQGEKIE